ncbi:MAG: T9SS type A sorting domain-containing protein [Chlorobi bacterium]|nr:T9SS type A sorting domain-containing protein [Chlorobiota bacterium]
MEKYILILIFSAFSFMALAQYQNVMISNVNNPEEPSISMDFANPDHLVAGANANKYFVSEDGGLSWSYDTIWSPSYGEAGDPCIIVDTAGDFYFLHLSSPPGGSWLDRIVCQKYDFENDNWNDGSFMGLNEPTDQDKEWAVVDSANNNIYVTWTQFDSYDSEDPDLHSNIMFSKSVDAGETWLDAKQINQVSGDCIDEDNTTEGAVPTIGPNGEIYVAWAGPEGIVFDKSIDQGETWLDEDIFVNSQPGGWDYMVPGIYRCNGLPITCCDISGTENNGAIYINWTDQRNGEDDTDVWIAKSVDGGETWSDAVRVNDDPAGKQQFFSWMTIDQTNGDIYIVFYDRRNHDDVGTDFYLAKSSDGGISFENILISESSFYPDATAFFGDYTNVVAHNGIVRPIWARADGKVMSVYTAIIDTIVGVEDNIPSSSIAMFQNYPNPFKQSTIINFKLKKDEIISLGVVDLYGRKICTIINSEPYNFGKYQVAFKPGDYKIKSGVYYFVLSSGHGRISKKMILVD